jgi:hypothetical protein
VFENGVLRRIFETKRAEVKGEWRKSHNEELHSYADTQISFGDQIKENEVGGACGTHGRREKIVRGFGGKARRKEIT